MLYFYTYRQVTKTWPPGCHALKDFREKLLMLGTKIGSKIEIQLIAQLVSFKKVDDIFKS